MTLKCLTGGLWFLGYNGGTMQEPIYSLLSQSLTILFLLLLILFYFFIAYIASQFSHAIARLLLQATRFAPLPGRPSSSRAHMVEGLVANIITFLAFLIALLSSLSLFVQPDTLVWMVGLFSAAFGIGAKDVVADLLAGIGFLFKNTFTIGEKVEFGDGTGAIQGTVEEVNLRNTLLRAPTGELYTLPNSGIRVIRNFSRSTFSSATVKFYVDSDDLVRAIDVLTALSHEAPLLLDDLLEPWEIITTAETVGSKTQLTILAKATFSKAATLRLQLMNLIYERLQAAEMALMD